MEARLLWLGDQGRPRSWRSGEGRGGQRRKESMECDGDKPPVSSQLSKDSARLKKQSVSRGDAHL